MVIMISAMLLFSYLICLFVVSPHLTLHPPYPSQLGYYREDAILLMRKFYLRENTHGQCPRTHNLYFTTYYVCYLTHDCIISSTAKEEAQESIKD
jgi:hypothetical protein